MARVCHWLWLCSVSMLVCCATGLRADEFESESLARRLNELEAEVARLKQKPTATPADAEWTPPLAGNIEQANNSFIPPSPAPLLEYPFAQMAPAPAAPPSPTYPTVKVNGVFQADMIYFDQNAASRALNGDIQDGADFRRFRLATSGAVASNVNYFAQLDFAFVGRPTFTDIWGEVTKVPVLGNVRFGQWKQPFSLEVPTSFRYQTFMERSVLFTSFEAFRHLGIGFYNNNDDETMTWAMSVFRQGQNQFAQDLGDSGGAASAGRLTWLPYYEKDGDSLNYLHWGGGYYIGDPSSNTLRYATIPEAFVGAFATSPGFPVGTSKIPLTNILNGTPPFADTGTFAAHMFSTLGVESLWVNGPLSFQTEAQMSTATRPAGAKQVTFWGFYTYGSYFLTGESRPYNRKLGVLDRVLPLRPFIKSPDCESGPGAWELALRWSYINLDSEDIHGGRLTDVTAGLNWYLNAYTKLQFNYIRAMQQPFGVPRASTDIFGLRAQVDW